MMLFEKILRRKRGETLMESLVALMLLSMLMLTIMSIIRFSGLVTANALVESNARQRDFNSVLLLDFDAPATGDVTTDVRFELRRVGETTPALAHYVEVYSDFDGNNIVAFNAP